MALQLWIRSGTQEQRAVELAANATVQDLMSAAREALGLASSGLRLSCGGVELRDPALPIADAGVAAEAVIDAQVGSVFQWDPVSLQHGYEFLYTVSEGGTEAQKTKRPEIITIIRTTRPAESGETFRVRVLQEGPQDECNGIGFGVGTTVHTTSPWHQVGAKPTTWDSCALNGAGSVCVQDSGGMIVDGADHPRPLPKLEAGCTVTVECGSPCSSPTAASTAGAAAGTAGGRCSTAQTRTYIPPAASAGKAGGCASSEPPAPVAH
eukprot:TRINITY_DN23067_c0_g1_i4.p1 TRINITY_DN23067_c0_g1~~TRINITY_DN23067_c0_g1_i4.p1  ORF type:complete len:289 (+),score=67.90 TRINITY_DN23067_c0_g1_i4:71-868(+)